MKSFSLLALLFLSFTVSASPSECEIEGEVVHWQMAFCMSMYETDDPGNPAVDSCFNNLDNNFRQGEVSECQIKRELATALCLRVMANREEIGSVETCLSSSAYVPSIVKEGGI
jgi:hypothetical protein